MAERTIGNMGSTLRRMCAASRRLRKESHEDVSHLLYGYGGITFLMTVLPFATFWATGQLVDTLVAARQGTASSPIVRDVGLLITLSTLLAALGPLYVWIRNLLTRRLRHKYVMAVSQAIARLDIAVIEAPDSQDAITKIVEQAPHRAPSFVQRTFELRQYVGELLIAAAIMFYATWWLALLLLLAMLPRLIVDLRYGRTTWLIQAQTADLSRKYWWSRWALTNPGTIPLTKIHGSESHFRRAMQDCHDRMMTKIKRHERIHLLWQWSALIAPQLVSMVAMYHFVFDVWHGALLVGQMTFLFGAVTRYSLALKSLSSNMGKQYEDGLFICEMFDLIDREPTVPRPVYPVSIRTSHTPAIEIVDATFAYPNGHVVLRDVNVSIEPGTSLGLVGANGAGKTTLIKFLLGFYHPVAGNIFGLDHGIGHLFSTSPKK
uniref:ATP-binding cassette domain-containing protein n=1 Tax=Candidatus Entotheonella palauensis TaxID=93172 RepID=UPI00277B4F2A